MGVGVGVQLGRLALGGRAGGFIGGLLGNVGGDALGQGANILLGEQECFSLTRCGMALGFGLVGPMMGPVFRNILPHRQLTSAGAPLRTGWQNALAKSRPMVETLQRSLSSGYSAARATVSSVGRSVSAGVSRIGNTVRSVGVYSRGFAGGMLRAPTGATGTAEGQIAKVLTAGHQGGLNALRQANAANNVTNSIVHRFATKGNLTTLLPNLSQAGKLTKFRVNIMMRIPAYRKWRAARHAIGDTKNSPFVSVLLDPVRGAQSPDPWLGTIITGKPGMRGVGQAPDLGTFNVPSNRLHDPGVDISRIETEMLFWGDDLGVFNLFWQANPFKSR